MADGIPDELHGDAAALYSTIGSFISQGIGADRAYRIIRDSGVTIPRSQVRQVAGEIRQSLGYRQSLASANPDNEISPRYVSDNSSLRTDNYVHTVSMVLRDKSTGYTFQQYYNYVAPDLVSPGEIYDAMDDAGGGNGDFYEFEIVASTLISVSHKP